MTPTMSQENLDPGFTIKPYLDDRRLRRAQDAPTTNPTNFGRNGQPPGTDSNGFLDYHSHQSSNLNKLMPTFQRNLPNEHSPYHQDPRGE
ncbi:hypothetical protein FOCG_10453 [Fusarium oxysporum f. sp. radicis-lycopersici 26381]|nr:hypothetical protein FOCG_10453 [Fusarium oxysporum f. sp. radicis-lycopersici 26381]